jgi:hypothetical protein
LFKSGKVDSQMKDCGSYENPAQPLVHFFGQAGRGMKKHEHARDRQQQKGSGSDRSGPFAFDAHCKSSLLYDVKKYIICPAGSQPAGQIQGKTSGDAYAYCCIIIFLPMPWPIPLP